MTTRRATSQSDAAQSASALRLAINSLAAELAHLVGDYEESDRQVKTVASPRGTAETLPAPTSEEAVREQHRRLSQLRSPAAAISAALYGWVVGEAS